MNHKCPECGGTGFVTLLVSREPCRACAGAMAANVVQNADGTYTLTRVFTVKLDGIISNDAVPVLYSDTVNSGPWLLPEPD